MKNRKTAIRLLALLLSCIFVLSGCNTGGGSDTSAGTDTSAVSDGPAPDPSYSADQYKFLSKEAYLDKTTAAFLGQLAGFLSGYEFVTSGGDRCRVAMPDSWFEYLNGPYAGNYTFKKQTDKLVKNTETGIYEVWFDDDFSVDVVNQYILADMYRQARTFSQKYISDGWKKFDVWDMGGGQRQVGAYGLVNRYNYLPQFAGNTEYGNWYSYCTESYLGADTIGMNAAGMPETAAELSGYFAQITGDRDNLLWAQMFATMMSLAYFESDIDTLISEASTVFPEGSWPLDAIDYCYELYEKYPEDWRAAYKELENRYFIHDTRNTNTSINCSFVILDLLYGGGDYMTTCQIGALAGYDCESTSGIALAILGIIGGMEILPEETNTRIWQDGEGILTNLNAEGLADDYWMTANGLPERIKIKSVIDKYRQNFETILKENGGAIDDNYYYIPIEKNTGYVSVEIKNPEFETGDLDGYTTSGSVTIDSTYPTKGLYTAKMQNNAQLFTKVSGLEVGETYTFTAFVRTSEKATAYLVARDAGGANAVCASVHQTVGTPKYEAQSTVKRTLVFTATAAEMEVGVIFRGTGAEFAFVDSLVIVKIAESRVGEVTVNNKSQDDAYTQKIDFSINSQTKKEAYLKLTFANTTDSVVNLPIEINNIKYSTASLYKTCESGNMKNIETVYIPLTLLEGNNIVSMNFGAKTIHIYEAEYVEIQSRF